MTLVPAVSRPVIRDGQGRFRRGSGVPVRRARGAMAGNLNASSHPWRAFWRRRALRPEDRWILPILADYAGSLVADRGGPEMMTAGEAHMIELAQLARGCTMLVLAEAARGGGIAGMRRSASWKVSAGVKKLTDPDLAGALGRFMKVEAAALQAIGLERRAKPVPSLSEYLAEKGQAPPGATITIPAEPSSVHAKVQR